MGIIFGNIIPNCAGPSAIRAITRLSTDAVKNCTIDILMPSHIGEKWSMVRMWMGKIIDAPMTSRSEGATVRSLLMQRK